MTASHTQGANPLQALAAVQQSPWLDFIRRSFVEDGSLARLVQTDDVRGVTSNPAIFQKAMGEGTEYDAQIKSVLAQEIVSPGTLYEKLAVQDIKTAAHVLAPVYEQTKRRDGFVSLEVSPYLARDEKGTAHEAARLWADVAEPNLMIKIPATPESIPAIRETIAAGINVNVTLIFALSAYKAVVDAWLSGLEDLHKKGGDLSGVASVASFFVSRIDGKIDAEIDRRVKAGDKNADGLQALRGKVAIANAKLAYVYWQEIIQTPRWKALAAAGAQPQRLLWASTGTKDKAYSDVLYVDNLIGPHTVNTLPPATMDAFRDHGTVKETLGTGIDAARHVLAEAERFGLNLEGVTKILVDEGVASFEEAFDGLLGSVAAKQKTLLTDKLTDIKTALPEKLEKAVQDGLDDWRKNGTIRKLWNKDASVWTGGEEAKWLKWLDTVDERLAHVAELESFQAEVKARGFKQVLLMGMGGSSLGPEVLAETFGKHEGFGHLYVLDSTDPQQVATYAKKIDPANTLFIVASKSGGTLEPNIMLAYFHDLAKKALGEKVGSHFVAITDPGSKLEALAKKEGFWKIFAGEPQIGGRYSVLSNFGLVPAAASGIPVKLFLEDALRGVRMSDASVPPAQNPGVLLGTILGVAATQFGHDKLTVIATPQIADFGAWLEQLVAESTGKHGKGIIPIDEETLGGPKRYGTDRLFVYLRLAPEHRHEQDEAIATLIDAGQPVVTITLHSKRQIAQEFFRWELATAVAGAFLGIDPFDQPDVEASKVETRKLTDAYNKTGKLPAEQPFAEHGPFAFFADKTNAAALKGDSAEAILKAHFDRVKAGDYVALLAYIERDTATREWIQHTRLKIRDTKTVATAAEFGPRFLHSTGQAYKGGPNTGVFLQITADDAHDLPVPGENYSFGVVKAAQARGDFDVLAERGRRALRVHIRGSLKDGLAELAKAVHQAV
ncbi:bifunctional transaldolase/phosoglucose isomerase [Acetobacter tropicalis]|uniref:Transaldolase n=1 Tax=Acetobacter tropicalis TaxID=104102 RepID=A0A094YTJ3_9PROT|nr:bifunctional transaldolase/phosoglucose isomerase [Acetobacter tropicalis]KAA8389858.1 bifunctional transaldolase/phosoglucose isomerase [Acetobacter tropicalis]KAA8392911.1 bifunctional transaldolase/phosoglucose isomerase [Acetobacter tropicalis]KGB25320.1 Transaldolase [Acetobacter tropicalis]MBC9007943.1 bifunctional transaldolase/phosoglucose isomerase [Acetobacter tropicalis]MDO8172556.1 bifunctional transaldolase/phosoglucose isomerase [Acetobacter tropicalis]